MRASMRAVRTGAWDMDNSRFKCTAIHRTSQEEFFSQAQEHESLHTSRQDAGLAIRHSKPRPLGDWGVRDRGCAHGGTGPARDCAKELVFAAVLEIAIRAVRQSRDGRRVGAAF